MSKFYQYILQLVLSPGKAWEDIGNDKDANAYELERSGMFPLMVIAGLSASVQLIYHSGMTVVDVIVRGGGIFVSLFAGFAIARQLFASFVNRYLDAEYDAERAKIVVVLGLSLMSLSAIICNLMPMQIGLPYLLSIYAALVVWRSSAYLGVNRDMVVGYLAFVLVSIALPPMLIQALFNYVGEL